MAQDHWLPGFNFNVEEWDAEGLHYETLAICLCMSAAQAVKPPCAASRAASRAAA